MKSLRPVRVVIVGTGYVGLTTGVCLAYIGHEIACVDVRSEVISDLQAGRVQIHEPGLADLLHDAGSNVRFSTRLEDFLPGAQVVMIAVGTPSKSNGDTDVSFVERAARDIGEALDRDTQPVIVNKSTVPIGSWRRVQTVIRSVLDSRGQESHFCVASNPEFLREGAAIHDTLFPDRIVVGSDSSKATDMLRELYSPILKQSFQPPTCIPVPQRHRLPQFIETTPTSAELTKYAANAFLAMKISFINEIACLAERVGADVKEVAQGIGSDSRIGPHYLNAGLGWGGSCFGKDGKSLLYTAGQYGLDMSLLQATIESNSRQRLTVIEKLQAALKVIRGRTIGILGLAFKPGTDDLRDAPSIAVIDRLLESGALVKVHDPVAMPGLRAQRPDLPIHYCESISDLSRGCDALVLVTEWPEYQHLDWHAIGGLMSRRVLIDGRNLFDRALVEKCGFVYVGVGR